MMKVKRYIIILITIFISMFISCKSVNKKLEKMNSFKFIGVWKINSVEVFDEDEADYTDNMLNKEIKIGSNEIKILDNNQVVGEFFLNSDTEMTFIYHGYLLNLTKISENVSFRSDEEEKDINSEIKYDDFDTLEGVMLGLKTPREELDDMSYTEESYKIGRASCRERV